MPTTQMTTIPSEAGLTRPAIAVDGSSSAPISTPATTRMTSSPSSTGVSRPTRYVSGRDGPTAKSQRSSTIVWIAMPPIRFPAASARLPEAAAEMVIASSGSDPASASRIRPPSSSPRPSRASSASVVFESRTPAAQVAAEAARKIRTRRGEPSPATPKRCGLRRTEQLRPPQPQGESLVPAVPVPCERRELTLADELRRDHDEPNRRERTQCGRADSALERCTLADHRPRPHFGDLIPVDLHAEDAVEEEVELVSLRALGDEHRALAELSLAELLVS